MLCCHAQLTVLSVTYRLAPEDPFPAAVDDAVAAFAWVRANADELGLDPDRIAVGGDSAGGSLAAVVCTQTKEAGGALPAFQLLMYPKTSEEPTRSLELFSEGFFLVDEDMNWFLNAYAPADADPRAYPMLTPDLSGLPPAYVVTAGFDPLRDEGEAYAAALAEAGVPTALRRHGSPDPRLREHDRRLPCGPRRGRRDGRGAADGARRDRTPADVTAALRP